MVKTKLYIARHGQTMFNAIGRAQGWSDTPLTKKGELGIKELGLGLKAEGLTFKEAFSSDSGRTLQTMRIILGELGQKQLPYNQDARIREWCFGSLEGDYDNDLFLGILPRTEAFKDAKSLEAATYQEIAEAIFEADTAGWAEPWERLKTRILEGFTAIAQKVEASGGGNAIIVCHGMTIATLLWLIDPNQEKCHIENGSVSVVTYEEGRFSIDRVADLSYRHQGQELMKADGHA